MGFHPIQRRRRGPRPAPAGALNLPVLSPIRTSGLPPGGRGGRHLSEQIDAQTAKARIRQVFRYLQEMHRVRTPPVVRLDEREWVLPLDPPLQSECVRRGYRLPGDALESGEPVRDEFIVKVGRPRVSECPEPSVVIKNWLLPGFDQIDADPHEVVRQELRSEAGGVQRFDESEERVEALEEWLVRKRAWEDSEREVVETLGVFADLFDLRASFERESEKYQLFLADGILAVDHPSGAVRHPVLLQRVELRFDPAIPEFTIVDSEDTPELYTPLLRHAGVDGKGIQQLCDALEREHFHPLDGESTSAFLRDLVQRFWTSGLFFESARESEGASGPYLYRQPHLFLGNRNLGLAESIERYLEALPDAQELPESLLRIVGIETGRAAAAREAERPIDLLLTKPANKEQEAVIRRLEETGAVLVQGPPGTGKSHTIANLIGHLLAQNKSILVTSHASKALRVVRGQLAPPLQPLCVSVLQSDEASTKQLEESITGIVNYLASTSEKKLAKEIERLEERRSALDAQQRELRRQLLDAVQGEYREAMVEGEKLSPSEVARRLAAAGGAHEWLPGPVAEGAALPLSPEEALDLYRLNAGIAPEREPALAAPPPDLSQLPSSRRFASLHDELGALEKQRAHEAQEGWGHEEQDEGSLAELAQAAKDAVEILRGAQGFALACIEAGRAGGKRAEPWLDLVRRIEAAAEPAPAGPAAARGAEVRSPRPLGNLIRTCVAIRQHLEAGGSLGRLQLLRKPEWKEFLRSASLGGRAPRRREDFEAVQGHLEARRLGAELEELWDRMLPPLGAPAWRELGERPEARAQEHAFEIRRALAWQAEVWAPCEAQMAKLGLDWRRLARKAASARSELEAIRETVEGPLGPLLEARRRHLRWRELCAERDGWIASLEAFSRKDPAYPLVKLFRAAVKKGDYDGYAEAWRSLEDLREERARFERREALLARVEAVAEPWARALRERRPPHDRDCVPGDLAAAWRHRLCEQALAAHARIDLDRLQERLETTSEALLEATAHYVEKKSWLAQLRRTGLEQQQALTGWLGLHKKIGKGGGKHVARLKQEAKRTLVQCRGAVPVWIMPLSRVVECFDLATTRFDVVIIDEASQSDVLGLVALALGREVVVVGDHEQVSPYAVGQSTDRIQALIDELLTDIPNRQLYDGRTSVYDLARQSFGGTIRLLEHFRCVPDIIHFSNQLCYGGEIRPLREEGASRVRPHLVAHRVANGSVRNGVNRNEALEVASLVSAICKLEEYAECTIGVISMVGTAQALYVDSLLRRRLSVAEYQRRKILCGNASQFQGDERDVILISMVDVPGEAPLHLRQRDDARKVVNVAASRARDQLWVVHSLDPGRDLKPADLRLRLIAHAEDPSVLRPAPRRERERFRSELEKEVFGELSRAGYRAIQHHAVGETEIDLVVEGEGRRRVAIQCDGDRVESLEAIEEEMEHQRTLRRLGWDFLRVRGSEFFRDRPRAVRRLLKRLSEREIQPLPPAPEGAAEAAPAAPAEEPLQRRVLRRAELIRTRWRDIPTVSSVVAGPARRAGARAEPDPGAEVTPHD
jgi:very-short-patch-repair endonuclease